MSAYSPETQPEIHKESSQEVLQGIQKFIHDAFSSVLELTDEELNRLIKLNKNSIKTYCEFMQQVSMDNLKDLEQKLLASHYGKTEIEQIFFVGASTIPTSPIVEVIYALILDKPIICQVSRSFNLEFFDVLKKHLPSEYKEKVQFIQYAAPGEETNENRINTEDLNQNTLFVLHGSDETIELLQKQILPKQNKKLKHKVIGFGHKTSFAIYDLEKTYAIAELANDIVAFNQLGCMSPQVIYLLNSSREQAKEFCQQLAQSLKQQKIKIEAGASFQKLSFLEDLSRSNNVFENSVIMSESAEFDYSFGYKTIWVKQIKKINDLENACKKLNQRVVSIGSNLAEEHMVELTKLFPQANLCKFGQMQTPRIDWIQTPTHVFDESC